ncbi:ATP-binding protein [Streptomyces sp. NPDC048606]|uniref:ATP-binding protein n=1 Tax=Streptomyces sp. NPDC048606 TaxID=3154726 RepID=UPI003442A300
MRLPPALRRGPFRGFGLRGKIAVLLAVGCSLVAVTIGVLIHEARVGQVADAARKGAIEQLVRVRQVYELTGRLDPDKVGEADARIDCPGTPEPLREAALAGRRTTYLDLEGPHPTVWAARPVGGEHVLSVRQSLAAEKAELAELDGRLVVFGTAVVALAAVGGALMAGRLSKDLRTAAETARRISAGDLDARIGPSGVPGTRDEVAALSSAVDTMAASLQGRLEAEQRFTADVAHELRTPLTGLHTAAELLPAGRPTELVRDRVAALRTLTEDLLEVARLDANREEARLEAHRLGPLVRSAVRRSGVTAEVSGGDGAWVRTDVRRLERILTNLLVNARRHGGGRVSVEVGGASVTVRDHGPGFPESLLRDGPRRFVTGTAERGQGTGLGLTIAFGQAQVIGAEVRLSNAPAESAPAPGPTPWPPPGGADPGTAGAGAGRAAYGGAAATVTLPEATEPPHATPSLGTGSAGAPSLGRASAETPSLGTASAGTPSAGAPSAGTASTEALSASAGAQSAPAAPVEGRPCGAGPGPDPGGTPSTGAPAVEPARAARGGGFTRTGWGDTDAGSGL